MTNKGRIPEELLQKIKDANPGVALYRWRSPNQKDEVIFKPISRKLLNKIQKMLDPSEGEIPKTIADINEVVFDSCVLWPEFTKADKEAFPVGLIPSIVKSIQEKSGFIDIDIFRNVLGPDVTTLTLRDHAYWGQPSDEELQKIKKEHNCSIVLVRIDRWYFVIRPMTRLDIQVSEQAEDDRQIALLDCVTIWPNEVDWGLVPAGVVDLLGRTLTEISGWDLEADVEEI